MKICMNEESIKACELSEENCFDCSYGKVFQYYVGLMPSWSSLLATLLNILTGLPESKKRCGCSKKIAAESASRTKPYCRIRLLKLAGVQADIFKSGVTLYQNLLFNHCRDNNSNTVPVDRCIDQASEQA